MQRLINDILNPILHWSGNLKSTHWMMIMVVVVVCGFFFLRGFGSRTSY